MNSTSSNGEKTRKKHYPPRHVWEIYAQLRREGGVSGAAVLQYALRHLPPMLLVVFAFYWLAQMALWQPLRKALFSYREELAFSYGDFILFFMLTLVLAGALLHTLWRMYRHQCRLLELCNFGATADRYRFSEDYNRYYFQDSTGQEHEKLFVLDYINLYPLSKRLIEDSREALPNFQLFAVEGARKCAKEIIGQQVPAQVYYHPAAPSCSQIVTPDCMNEYFWRK